MLTTLYYLQVHSILTHHQIYRFPTVCLSTASLVPKNKITQPDWIYLSCVIWHSFPFISSNWFVIMFIRHANIQHIDWNVPLFGRGAISEDLKSILITVIYSTSQFFAHLPCPSSNLAYRSLESTLNKSNYMWFVFSQIT